MKNIVIRKAQRKDLPSIVDIQVNGWQSSYKGILDDKFLNSMDRESILARRRKDFQENTYIVALIDNEVVSFSRYIYSNKYTPDSNIDCEIMALYVRNDKKRLGIGKRMLEYVINDFKHFNKEHMVIWCLKDNIPARKFYEAMGGKIYGEHDINLGNKNYPEVGYIYNIKND